MILNPLEEFVVARQLNDPNDVTTYYVRALIRNAKTDTLIATLDLDDKGSQRFTKTWQVPQDPTGQGFYITVTSLVYTNAGYTVLSTVYGSEQYELLIQDRINPFLGVGGSDIDYKKVRQIIQEELQALPSPVKPKDLDLSSVMLMLNEVRTQIRSIEFPAVSLEPVTAELQSIKDLIRALPKPIETDLSPLTVPMDDLFNRITEISKKIDVKDNTKAKEIQQTLDKFIKQMDSLEILLVSPEEKVEPKVDILKEYLNGT